MRDLLDDAVTPLAGNAELRRRLLEIRRARDLVVDETSEDELLDAYGVVDTERAQVVVVSWQDFITANKDEITALQVLYGHRKASFEQLKELADRIKRPPYNWTPDLLWSAYAALDESRTRVRRADRHTVTDLIALVRYALAEDSDLVPYSQTVQERYEGWLAQQAQAGATFTDEQRWWLDRIAETVAMANGITVDDFEEAPFSERGGVDGAIRDLGPNAQIWLDQLNADLTA